MLLNSPNNLFSKNLYSLFLIKLLDFAQAAHFVLRKGKSVFYKHKNSQGQMENINTSLYLNAGRLYRFEQKWILIHTRIILRV